MINTNYSVMGPNWNQSLLRVDNQKVEATSAVAEIQPVDQISKDATVNPINQTAQATTSSDIYANASKSFTSQTVGSTELLMQLSMNNIANQTSSIQPIEQSNGSVSTFDYTDSQDTITIPEEDTTTPSVLSQSQPTESETPISPLVAPTTAEIQPTSTSTDETTKAVSPIQQAAISAYETNQSFAPMAMATTFPETPVPEDSSINDTKQAPTLEAPFEAQDFGEAPVGKVANITSYAETIFDDSDLFG